ncbi:MAG: hypothetical protein E7306_05200 [Butyrivibrio sp.]|nr:hypothetical protein [Butyrivibrio sp.]
MRRMACHSRNYESERKRLYEEFSNPRKFDALSDNYYSLNPEDTLGIALKSIWRKIKSAHFARRKEQWEEKKIF